MPRTLLTGNDPEPRLKNAYKAYRRTCTPYITEWCPSTAFLRRSFHASSLNSKPEPSGSAAVTKLYTLFDLEWLKATRACRYWRAIAVDIPHLWAEPIFQTPALAELFLHRSKKAPMVVRTSSKTNWQPSFSDDKAWRNILCSALSQTSRLYCVELEVNPDDDHQKALSALLPNLSRFPASALEILVVKGTNAGITLPKDFLQAGAPILKHLEMKNYNYDLKLLSITQLTHLRINWGGSLSQRRPPVKPFLSCFRDRRYLQNLELGNALPGDCLLSTGNVTPLAFQSLILQDSAPATTSFICTISTIPAAARVHVAFNDFDPDRHDRPLSATTSSFDTFLLALNDCWRDAPGDRSRADDDAIEFHLFDFGPYNGVSRMELWFEHHGIPADLDVEFLTFNVDVEGLLRVLDEWLDISTVMTLFVEHCESFTDNNV
jgi:hypothetical protein